MRVLSPRVGRQHVHFGTLDVLGLITVRAAGIAQYGLAAAWFNLNLDRVG